MGPEELHPESLTLVGYLPKRTPVPGEWASFLPDAHITEIGSVSCCIAKPPDGWIDHWIHNEWGFFNSPADARSVISSRPDEFSIYAYQLLPARFDRGERHNFTIEDLPVEPLGPSFVTLGFDIVSRSVASHFECSPLSCNGLANEVKVNRFCLVDSLDEARSLAARFSLGDVEPGPYYVLNVWRNPTHNA